MKEWSDFFVATAGAAAALSGLIFVGVSISLQRILSFPTLPERALIAVIILVNILLCSVLMLVPGQTPVATGAELFAVSWVAWIMVARFDISIYRRMDRKYIPKYYRSIFLNQISLLPFCAAALLFLFRSDAAIYFFIPGVILSFSKAVLDSWVLLIEIHR